MTLPVSLLLLQESTRSTSPLLLLFPSDTSSSVRPSLFFGSLPHRVSFTDLRLLSSFAVTKRFLKKSTLREFIRVVAASKDSYELRFYNVQGEDGEEEEGEDME